MSESVEVRLARIEEMLRAHFARDDERASRWADHEERIVALEAEENKRRGGKAMLATLIGAAAIVGGLIAKMIPWGVK